jgi:hypothetical protein
VVILTWLASLKKVYKLLTFISNYIEADTKSQKTVKILKYLVTIKTHQNYINDKV